MRWTIEFWDGQLPLLAYTSDTYKATQCPDRMVVRMTIENKGCKFVCVGWDNYFLSECEDGSIRFGGWIDAESEYGDGEGGGREYFWPADEDRQYMIPIKGEPRNVRVLRGGLVPKPESQILGLED